MMPVRRLAAAAALSVFIVRFFAFGAGAPSAAFAEMSVEVGGAPMYPSRTIFENAADSKDHAIFVAAVKAADLADSLQGPGPFTLFAPVNKAFEKLPKGGLDLLLKPENHDALRAMLDYHVLPGKYSIADFIAAIRAGGGKAVFKTVEGEDLTVVEDGRRLELIDQNGGISAVIISDVNQKNGVIHVVDAVLRPAR